MILFLVVGIRVVGPGKNLRDVLGYEDARSVELAHKHVAMRPRGGGLFRR